MTKSVLSFVFDSLLHPQKDETLQAQSIRQVLSGSASTLADIGIFWFSLTIGFHPMTSAVISFVFAALTNFTITKYYVIGGLKRQKKKTMLQLLAYFATALVSLAIAQLFLLVFSVILDFNPLYVKIVSVPFVFVWTVLSSRYFIFNKKD
jgi:putative flippase GtrA